MNPDESQKLKLESRQKKDATREKVKQQEIGFILKEVGPQAFSEEATRKLAERALDATFPSWFRTLPSADKEDLVVAETLLRTFKNTGEENCLEDSKKIFQNLSDETNLPVRTIALMGLARVASTKREWEEALLCAQKVLRSPEDWKKDHPFEFSQIYSFLGDQYYKQIDFDPLYDPEKTLDEHDPEFSGRKAFRWFSKANEFPLPLSSFRLSKLYSKMDQYRKSEEICNEAVAQWEQANSHDIEKGLEKYIDTPMAEDLAHLFTRVGGNYSRAKMQSLAHKYFDRAIQLRPYEAATYAAKARAYASERKNELALNYAKLAVERNPDNKLALSTIATSEFYSGTKKKQEDY